MGTEILNWLEEHAELLQQFGHYSIVFLVVTILALPVIVMKLPADYFTNEKRETARRTRQHPLVWAILSLGKNLLGLFLILIGIAMLVLPGQGTVTILIGLAISNFPGKFAIERRIACQPAVGKTLNKIRQLTGVPPLQMPATTEISQ